MKLLSGRICEQPFPRVSRERFLHDDARRVITGSLQRREVTNSSMLYLYYSIIPLQLRMTHHTRFSHRCVYKYSRFTSPERVTCVCRIEHIECIFVYLLSNDEKYIERQTSASRPYICGKSFHSYNPSCGRFKLRIMYPGARVISYTIPIRNLILQHG